MQHFDLKRFRVDYNITQSRLSEMLSCKQSFISAVERGSRDLPQDKIYLLTEIYGDLSQYISHSEKVVIIEQKGRPYYNVDFVGGFDFKINDQTVLPAYYIDYEPYNKDGVVWVNMTGSSMEPVLNNGDVVALQEIGVSIEYIPYGEIYAIVTDDFRTIKKIRKSEKDGFIKLIPINTNGYDEQEIPASIIRKVFRVLGSIKKL